MRKFSIVLMLLCVSFLSNAQFENTFYKWDKNPVRHTITEEEEQEKSVILKDTRIFEYAFNTEGTLQMLTVYHKIIRVNDASAIDANNKVFISLNNVIELVDLNVRSISKAGKVTELNKNNIKEVENLENAKSYKIFAIEGVEVGSEIEYCYILKKSPKFFGGENVQFTTPNKNIRFEIISPENLIFETKSYNGFAEMKDTVYDSKRYVSVSNKSTPPLTEEEYANYARNRMRVEYKLSYNTKVNEGKSKIFTFSEATQRIYSNTHTADAKADKAILKLIGTMGIKDLPDTEAKIQAIEKYLKSNFVLVEANSEQFSDIAFILKNKQSTETGIVRLYNRIFELSSIKYQLVLTTDRTELPFDKTFESWDYLDSYLYYFPSTDKFLIPGRSDMRYPMIPYKCTDNYGLFITPVSVGTIRSGISEVKYIPENSYKESYDNLKIALSFKMEEEKVLIDLTRSLGGYVGNSIVAFYDELSAEDKSKLLKQLSEGTIEDAQMVSGEAKNTDKDICTFYTPLTLNFKMESTTLMQNAGNKYIFSIGKVIGEQSQLYQEKVRKQPVENDYNRAYIRSIELTVPEGYSVSNLDKIKIYEELKENGNTSCIFKSDYKIEGNKVIITIEEYYSQIHYTLSQFEAFRKVINAAADFNKVTVIFQKK